MSWLFRSAVPTTKKLHLAKTGVTALKVLSKKAPRAKRVVVKGAFKARKIGF